MEITAESSKRNSGCQRLQSSQMHKTANAGHRTAALRIHRFRLRWECCRPARSGGKLYPAAVNAGTALSAVRTICIRIDCISVDFSGNTQHKPRHLGQKVVGLFYIFRLNFYINILTNFKNRVILHMWKKVAYRIMHTGPCLNRRELSTDEKKSLQPVADGQRGRGD